MDGFHPNRQWQDLWARPSDDGQKRFVAPLSNPLLPRQLLTFSSLLCLQEDALLLEFIEHNKVEIDSPQDIQLEYWAYAADYVDAGWTGKRCRDRYINHLRPGIKKGDWSPDEIKLIREMYNSMGSK